jgi:hypothetical protein
MELDARAGHQVTTLLYDLHCRWSAAQAKRRKIEAARERVKRAVWTTKLLAVISRLLRQFDDCQLPNDKYHKADKDEARLGKKILHAKIKALKNRQKTNALIETPRNSPYASSVVYLNVH